MVGRKGSQGPRTPVPAVLRIGTRKSPLALRQAEAAAERLRRAAPGLETVIVGLEARGDRWASVSLWATGGTGLFTADLEAALLEGRVDVAVHSLKDLPTAATPGLVVAAVPEREDPSDVLVTPARGAPARGAPAPGAPPADGFAAPDELAALPGALAALPPGARVGTSSLRRAAQVLRLRPDLRCLPIRGNVGTRLRKLAAGDYDAVLLAAAGLLRLGLAPDRGRLESDGARFRVARLPLDAVLPAPGQGALALQVRRRDSAVRDLVAAVDDPAVRAAVTAERALLAALEGGCRLPVAAHATVEGGRLRLRGRVVAPDGSRALEDAREGPVRRAAALGRRAAAALLDAGAGRLLREAPEAAGSEAAAARAAGRGGEAP